MAEFEFDFGTVDDDSLDGEYRMVEPGEYQVVVEDIDDSFTKSETAILVRLKIDGGQPDGQEGLTHTERLSTSPRAVVRIAKFAEAAGIATRDAMLGKRVNLDLQSAVGARIGVKIERETFKGRDGEDKESRRVSFLGFYALAGNGESNRYSDL